MPNWIRQGAAHPPRVSGTLRESGAFTSAHEAFWAASRRVNGDADGTRELIDVLLLHRSMDAGDVQAGITAALGVGAVSADVVAVEACRRISSIPGSGPARTVIPWLEKT
jgi:hypothetical protein